MPTIEVDPDELRRLTGREVADDELVADLFNLGVELEGRTEAGHLELEFAPDRLDRLSVEGLARSLRYQYGIDRGVYVPDTTPPEWTAIVEDSVPPSRPFVTAFVVRDLDLTEDGLRSLLQLQEKLHRTMGRRRRKGAIGVHDLTMLKGTAAGGTDKTIRYVGVAGDGDRFVPLESDEAFTPAAVIDRHHIGRQYGHLVDPEEGFPAIYDDIGLFSLPPIVNGRRTEVTADTRDLLVELTGTDQRTIDRMSTILAYALDARGGRLERVTVRYDDRELDRPDLEVREKRVEHARIERLLGVDLDPDTVVDLFERAGLDPAVDGTDYVVGIPPYRTDVLHPLDLVDDVCRAYGVDRLEPRYPEVGTVGGRIERSRLEDTVREGLIGLGFEDLVNFHLIGESANYDRLGLEPGADVYGADRAPRIAEPYSEAYELVRTWVVPSLMLVLENNTHRRYPQHLAEIGLVTRLDGTEPTGVAESRAVGAVLADPEAGYEDARARLQFLAGEHGAELATPATSHPTFLDGRVATVELDGEPAGIVGEIHPRVLEAYELEVPVAAFEFDLAALAR
ncbi:MAG: phenylalanine--tRNA ligase subunit beta [Halobacteriota archaeon]